MGVQKVHFLMIIFDVILLDFVYENWGRVDSNNRIPKERDLQSLAIDRYATPPNAGERT
jgi:hypothetical protein